MFGTSVYALAMWLIVAVPSFWLRAVSGTPKSTSKRTAIVVGLFVVIAAPLSPAAHSLSLGASCRTRARRCAGKLEDPPAVRPRTLYEITRRVRPNDLAPEREP